MDYRAEAERLIAEHLAEMDAGRYYDGNTKDYEVGRAILGSDPLLQAAILLALTKVDDRTTQYRLQGLRHQLVSRGLPLSAADLEELLSNSVKIGHLYGQWGVLLRKLRRFSDENGDLTPVMRDGAEAMSAQFSSYDNEVLRKFRSSIDALLGNPSAELPDQGEPWADAARAEVNDSPEWGAIFTHAATADGGKPSAKWLAEAERNRRAVDATDFNRNVASWLSLVTAPVFDSVSPKEPAAADLLDDPRAYDKYLQAEREYRQAVQAYQNSISEKNITLLKGLAWYAGPLQDAELARGLGHMAEVAYQRTGWATRAGNAAIWALGRLPGGVGVGPLARLRTRLRDRSALKLVAASVETAAKNANMTVDELEDLAVPTGGLGADGTRREVFGSEAACG